MKKQKSSTTVTAANLKSPKVAAKKGKKKKSQKHEQHSSVQRTEASPSKRSAQKLDMDRFEMTGGSRADSEFVGSERQFKKSRKSMTGRVNIPSNFKGRGVDNELGEIKLGSWDPSTKVEDIEAYLVASQRKFVKYRLNIFYLNTCALRIQHFYLKALQRRRRQAIYEAKKKIQNQDLLTVQHSQNCSGQQINHDSELQQQSPIHSVTNVSSISGDIQGASAVSWATTTMVSNGSRQQEIAVKNSQNDDGNEIECEHETSNLSRKHQIGKVEGAGAADDQYLSAVAFNKETPQFKVNSRYDAGDSELLIEDADVQIIQIDQHQQDHHQKQGQKRSRRKKSTKITESSQYQNFESVDIKHGQSQRSSFMLATASSKSRQSIGNERDTRVRSIRSSQGVGNGQKTSTSVTKNKNGAVTTTTTVTTTTYTIKEAGQTLKSSKSTEKFTRNGSISKQSSAKKPNSTASKKRSTKDKSRDKEVSRALATDENTKTIEIEDEHIEVLDLTKQQSAGQRRHSELNIQKEITAEVLSPIQKKKRQEEEAMVAAESFNSQIQQDDLPPIQNQQQLEEAEMIAAESISPQVLKEDLPQVPQKKLQEVAMIAEESINCYAQQEELSSTQSQQQQKQAAVIAVESVESQINREDLQIQKTGSESIALNSNLQSQKMDEAKPLSSVYESANFESSNLREKPMTIQHKTYHSLDNQQAAMIETALEHNSPIKSAVSGHSREATKNLSNDLYSIKREEIVNQAIEVQVVSQICKQQSQNDTCEQRTVLSNSSIIKDEGNVSRSVDLKQQLVCHSARKHQTSTEDHKSQISEQSGETGVKMDGTGTTRITRLERVTKQQRQAAKLQKQKELELLQVHEKQKQLEEEEELRKMAKITVKTQNEDFNEVKNISLVLEDSPVQQVQLEQECTEGEPLNVQVGGDMTNREVMTSKNEITQQELQVTNNTERFYNRTDSASCTTQKHEKNLRSLGVFSPHTTVSMEQKKTTSRQGDVSGTMVASKSFSRFQDRYINQNKNQQRLNERANSRHNEVQTFQARTSSKAPESAQKSQTIQTRIYASKASDANNFPSSLRNDQKTFTKQTEQKEKPTMTEEEREERRIQRERQIASMNRLMKQTTVVSRAKSRKASRSNERLAEKTKDDKQSLGLNTQKSATSTQKYIAAARDKSSNAKFSNQAFGRSLETSTGNMNVSRRDLRRQAKNSVTQNGLSSLNHQSTVKNVVTGRNTTTTTLQTTTTTRSFVNGKEQRTTVQKHREKSLNQIATPRLTMSNLRKVRDISPINSSKTPNANRQGMKTTSASTINLHSKFSNKIMTGQEKEQAPEQPAPASQEHATESDEGHKLSGTGEAASLKEEVATQDFSQAKVQSIEPEPQQMQGSQQHKEAVVEDVKDEPLPSAIMQQSSAGSPEARKQDILQKVLPIAIAQTKDQDPHDLNELSSHRNIQQTGSRGFPSASEARAARRRQRDQEKQQTETDTQQQQQCEKQKQRSKSTSSYSFATSSSKSITFRHHQQMQQQKWKAEEEQKQMQRRWVAPMTGTIKVGSNTEPQQLFSEQQDKSRSQIGDETLYREQSRFMSEQQQQLEQHSEVTSSLREFEHAELKIRNEERRQSSDNYAEYDNAIKNMSINLKSYDQSRQSNMTESVEGSKAGRFVISAQLIKEEQKPQISKAFLEDISLTKIERTYRRDFVTIKEVLQANYMSIVSIFMFYAGQSNMYPVMSIDDFMLFCRDTGLLGQPCSPFNEAQIMKCITQTIATSFKESGEKSITRYDFMEVLAHISGMLHKDQASPTKNSIKGVSTALQSFLKEWVFPNAQRTNRNRFWRYISADKRVIELLNKNSEVLVAAFKQFTHERKPRIGYEESLKVIRECQLDITERQLSIAFAESLQLVGDLKNSKDRMSQQSFSEFVYFLCRVTELHYLDTMYEAEEYWIKLDHMILFLMDPFNLKPQFRYGAKFSYDSQQSQHMTALARCDESEESEGGKSQDSIEETGARLMSNKKTESHRYQTDVMEDDMQPVEPNTELSGIQVVHTTHEGEIQAWPQPHPSAYPQYKEMSMNSTIMMDHSHQASGLTVMEGHTQVTQSQQFKGTCQVTVTEHQVSQVAQKQRRSAKMRTSVKHSESKQDQQHQ